MSPATSDTAKTPALRIPPGSTPTIQKGFLDQLLSGLPEFDRWLILSRDVSGASLAELSGATGLSDRAIRLRLLGIRQRLVAAAVRLHPQYLAWRA